MKKLLPFMMMFLLAMTFLQCADPGKKGDDMQTDDSTSANDNLSSTGSEGLRDIYWKLTSLKMIPLAEYAAQNKEPFLRLKTEGNRAEGTGGCNSMGGTYELKPDNQIVFSQMISTKMACPDMMMETEFHAALEEARKYQTDGKVLTLFNDAGIPLAKFEASAPQ